MSEYLDRNDEKSVEPYLYSDEFATHMSAMTGEELHGKSDIAIELARRDIKIKELQEFVIWMTGCGYDFPKHDYFIEQRDKLLKSEK